MKMGCFMRVSQGIRVLAIVLILPIGRILAAGWEDGIALDNSHAPANAEVLPPELPAVEGGGLTPFQGAHGEPHPWDRPEAPDSDPTLTHCEQYGAAECRSTCCDAKWTFRADALLLWRNAPSSRPIYSTIVPGTERLGPTALDADDLTSDVLGAPRLSLLRTNCEGHTFEATYFYAGNFYSERSLPYSEDGYATSPPGIYGNSWGPPDTGLDSATAQLIGQLQSVEFNTRHCIWADTCQFLIGARWLQWNETLQMTDSFYHTTPPPPPVIGTDFYQTQCFNNLWGGQIGLDTLLLGRVGQARVEGLVKAGAYYNAAGQTSAYTYTTEPPFTFSRSNRNAEPGSAAFVGEIGMTAVIPICCNWDFRCGYFGLWLTGLAQPTNQLSHQTITQVDAPSGTLDTTGRLILQGLSLGLEGRW
jgi:hypothetical protein